MKFSLCISLIILFSYISSCTLAQPSPPAFPSPPGANNNNDNNDAFSQFFGQQQDNQAGPPNLASPPGFPSGSNGIPAPPRLGPQGFPNLNANLGGSSDNDFNSGAGGFGAGAGALGGLGGFNGLGGLGGFGGLGAAGAGGAGNPFSVAANVFSPQQIAQLQQSYAAAHGTGLSSFPTSFPGTFGAPSPMVGATQPFSQMSQLPGVGFNPYGAGVGNINAFGNTQQVRAFQGPSAEPPFSVPMNSGRPSDSQPPTGRPYPPLNPYSNARPNTRLESPLNQMSQNLPRTLRGVSGPQMRAFQATATEPSFQVPASGYSGYNQYTGVNPYSNQQYATNTDSYASLLASAANSFAAPGNPLTAPGTPLGAAFGPTSPLNAPGIGFGAPAGPGAPGTQNTVLSTAARSMAGLDNMFNGIGQTLSGLGSRLATGPPPESAGVQGFPGISTRSSVSRSTTTLMRPTTYETNEPTLEPATVDSAA